MKKLELVYHGKAHTFEIGKLTIFCSPADSGKTEFSQFLERVFNGTEKNCLIDNQKIIKGTYIVKLIEKEMNIHDEIKLGAKSTITTAIKKSLAELQVIDQDESVQTRLNFILEELQELVQTEFMHMTDVFDGKFALSLSIKSLFDLIKVSTNFIEGDMKQGSLSKLMNLRLQLYQSHQNSSVIIIDDFDNDLDIGQMIDVLEWINCLDEDVAVILLTKSAALIRLMQFECSIYSIPHAFLSLNKIYQLIYNEVPEIEYNSYRFPVLCEEAIIQLTWQLKTVLSHEICNIVVMNKGIKYIEKLRKNRIYDTKTINFLEKIRELLSNILA